jgi:hypothetical protein
MTSNDLIIGLWLIASQIRNLPKYAQAMLSKKSHHTIFLKNHIRDRTFELGIVISCGRILDTNLNFTPYKKIIPQSTATKICFISSR